PCQGHTCEAPKLCQVGPAPARKPECRCSYVCPTEINLVCGTDGRTYSNQCLLRKQACKSRADIRVLYNGKCSPGFSFIKGTVQDEYNNANGK
ncbi:turripeptide Lol9.1, partial [Aplysia californica]|uniref:Turripeptide Lol9.1 n=1 Tax=Aplysia californica TaxID=6500 RepID=A0ABM0KAM7_APLCA